MKMHPVGEELLHAEEKTEGHTDRHAESNSHFSQFLECV